MSITKVSIAPELRQTHRLPTELKTIVRVKETVDNAWKEITVVRTVSRNGAGFTLERPVTVGRLVMLVMPLDPALRAYDKKEENYPIMGLVQYCNEGLVDDKKAYHVGVGFVGRTMPESYKADPKQSYHITGMTEDGLWQIGESTTPFKARKFPRFSVSMEVTVSLIKKGKKGDPKNPDSRETTQTRNISATGASVVTTLDGVVGDKVKFGSKQHDFYAIATVRNRDESDENGTTLHLEFVDTHFPMEKIFCGQLDITPGATDPVENEVKILHSPVNVPREAFEFILD